MMRKRTKSARRRRSAETELSEECSAFLCGSYREYLDMCGRSIPAWAWVNVLAHGSRDDIEIVATMSSDDGTPEGLIGECATAVVAALENGESLVGLQRKTLVPLELALADAIDAYPTNSAELGRALRSVLGPGALGPI
jgi:hypothetical protein